MIEVIGKLSAEDLNLLRITRAKLAAVQANPRAYSATETERAYLDDMRINGDICERYGIDSTRSYIISTYSGDIYYDG